MKLDLGILNVLSEITQRYVLIKTNYQYSMRANNACLILKSHKASLYLITGVSLKTSSFCHPIPPTFGQKNTQTLQKVPLVK